MAKKNVRVSADYIVYDKIPEGLYQIPDSDWKRIKQMAKRIKYPKRWFNILGSGCFGITTSAIVQVIYNSCNLSEEEKWYDDPMIIVSILSLFFGLLLYLADNERNKSIEKAGAEIVAEMDNIESKYRSPIEDAERGKQDNNNILQ